MKYNTQLEKLKMPEYGRLVQLMVEHAMTINDKDQRQLYAQRIVNIMAHKNNKMKNVPDYAHKLWNHLAYISDYKLEVDYPYPIQEQIESKPAQKLPYPKNNIHFRHYGYLVERALNKLAEVEDEGIRKRCINQIVEKMKSIPNFSKGSSSAEERLARDIYKITDGKLSL